jgi:hypothetical protein
MINKLKKENNVIIKRINDWLECYQNKDDGFYNATQLLRDYNEHYPENPKKMIEFLRNKNTQNYIGSVLNDEETPSDNSHDGCDELIHFKKGRNTRYGRTYDTYYFAPMLFSKFGTWLSSDLERDIHKVLWNNILEYRNEVAKLMPELKESIKDFKCDGNIYIKLHSMLQCAVFGKYQPNQQPLDKADENDLFRYKQLQNEIITLIKFNVIKDYDDLKAHIQGYYL